MEKSTSRLFSNVPESVKARVRDGLVVLAKLPTDRLANLVEVIKKSVHSKNPPFDSYAEDFDVSSEEMSSLMMAATLSASILSAGTFSAEEFVQTVVEGQFLEETHTAPLLEFAKIVLEGAYPFGDALSRQRLASQIIPSFVEWYTTIDVRVRVQGEQVSDTVPVLIVHLLTDMEERPTIFQMTKEDVEQLIKQLQEVKSQLQTTEEWVEGQHSLGEGD